MQTIFATAKVNNEIELCEVYDLESRREIEKEFLRNRISYYIRWPKTTIFSKHKNLCVICVNENSLEEAEDIVQMLCDELGFQVRFILKRSRNGYL